MFRYLPILLLLAACARPAAVDNPVDIAATRGQAALPAATPAPTAPETPALPTLPKAPDPVPVPTPASVPVVEGALLLAAGEQAQVAPKATLRFDKLLNDSRCPPDVQCIWAGEVRLGLSLVVAGETETFELASTTAPSKRVRGFAIELLAFGPCPPGHAAPKTECASLKATAPAQ